MDLNISLSNGQTLRGFTNPAGEDLKAVIVMVHGLGEHIHRYSDWAGSFNKNRIGFTGVDLPGHGLSDGKKGHIRSYRLTDEMIEKLISGSKMRFPAAPVFLYGHSLGGGIVLDYLVRKKPDIRGAIVTSPWLKLSFEPKQSKIKLAAIMKNILPSLVQDSGLVVDHISHTTEVVENYKKDPLVNGKISVSLFHSAMSAGANALKNASALKTPLLLIHGSEDQICSPEGSREFASKTKMAEFRLWEDGYHELHNEAFKDEVFAYILNWINLKLD
jgi:acylglycerol lipase